MVYVIQVCCVYSENLLTIGTGTACNMYSFISKNEFEKLVQLVGFTITNKETFLLCLVFGPDVRLTTSCLSGAGEHYHVE
jgi:hypothetical protein